MYNMSRFILPESRNERQWLDALQATNQPASTIQRHSLAINVYYTNNDIQLCDVDNGNFLQIFAIKSLSVDFSKRSCFPAYAINKCKRSHSRLDQWLNGNTVMEHGPLKLYSTIQFYYIASEWMSGEGGMSISTVLYLYCTVWTCMYVQYM